MGRRRPGGGGQTAWLADAVEEEWSELVEFNSHLAGGASMRDS